MSRGAVTGRDVPEVASGRRTVRGLVFAVGLFLMCGVPLAQAARFGIVLHAWRKYAKAVQASSMVAAETANTFYVLGASLVIAAVALVGGYLFLKARPIGLRLAKLSLLLLIMDTLFYPLLIYLLPYPPLTRSDILFRLGGLSPPELFLRAAFWGAILAWLILSRSVREVFRPGEDR